MTLSRGLAQLSLQAEGARRAGKGGALAPPLEFEKMTSYAAVLHILNPKYPKFFARASGARHRYPIFQSTTAQKVQKFSFAPSARRKMVDILYGTLKRFNFLKCRWFCSPLKIFCGRPCLQLIAVVRNVMIHNAIQLQNSISTARGVSSASVHSCRAGRRRFEL